MKHMLGSYCLQTKEDAMRLPFACLFVLFLLYFVTGPAQQIAQALPSWSFWPLAIVTGVGMAVVPRLPLYLALRRHNRQGMQPQ